MLPSTDLPITQPSQPAKKRKRPCPIQTPPPLLRSSSPISLADTYDLCLSPPPPNFSAPPPVFAPARKHPQSMHEPRDSPRPLLSTETSDSFNSSFSLDSTLSSSTSQPPLPATERFDPSHPFAAIGLQPRDFVAMVDSGHDFEPRFSHLSSVPSSVSSPHPDAIPAPLAMPELHLDGGDPRIPPEFCDHQRSPFVFCQTKLSSSQRAALQAGPGAQHRKNRGSRPSKRVSTSSVSKKRKRVIVSKFPPLKREGFCELCSVKYTDVDLHLYSAGHKSNASNNSNFAELDAVFASIGDFSVNSLATSSTPAPSVAGCSLGEPSWTECVCVDVVGGCTCSRFQELEVSVPVGSKRSLNGRDLVPPAKRRRIADF
jgi:hypothetical protein